MLALTNTAIDDGDITDIPHVTGIRREGRFTVVIGANPASLEEHYDSLSEIVFSFPLRTPWSCQDAVFIA